MLKVVDTIAKEDISWLGVSGMEGRVEATLIMIDLI